MRWNDFACKCAYVNDVDNPMLLHRTGHGNRSALYPKVENPEELATHLVHAKEDGGWGKFVLDVPQLRGIAGGAGEGISAVRDWWQDDHVVEVPDRVKSFYDELVPAIRDRMARDSNDYDHSMFRPGFYNDVKIKRDGWIPDIVGASGFTFLAPGINRVYLDSGWRGRDDLTRSMDVVHELKHVQNRDGFVSGSGRTSDDDQLLQEAYPYTTSKYSYKWPVPQLFGNGLDKWERASSHQERVFRHYYELWDKLNRKPTPQEYFNYIDNMSDWRLQRDYLRFVNGYEDSGWKKDGPGRGESPVVPSEVLQSYRNALSVIASNDQGVNAGEVHSDTPWNVKSAGSRWSDFT